MYSLRGAVGACLWWALASCPPWCALSLVARQGGRLPASASIDPLVYVHMPKCGSSFATVLAHHTCGNAIPDYLDVREPNAFLSEYGQFCDESKFDRFRSGHEPLRPDHPRKHAVTMFRDPRQRIMSGYYAGLHDCQYMQRQYGCKAGHECHSKVPVLEYGECVENCTANMLTNRTCGTRGPAAVQDALKTVDELGFVGLTEQWELSICLWHAKFGGAILPVELWNLHAGQHTHSGNYDVDALGDWIPEVDTLVFEAALKRFDMDLNDYGVTNETCNAMMSAAGVSSSRLLEVSP